MNEKTINVSDEQRIYEGQILVAKKIGLPPEMIEELEDSSLDYMQREWLSIAMKMGVTLEIIKKMKRFTPKQIYRELMESLRVKLVGTDLLKKTVDEELKQCRAALEENRKLRETLMNNLESSMKQTTELLQEKIERLEKDLQKKNDEIKILSKGRYPEQPKTEQAEEILSDIPDQKVFVKIQEKIKRLLERPQKDFKVIEAYIKDPDMNDEQKGFILDAWEEGMAVQDIRAFANKNLSVDIMRRIKESIQRRNK